jgi:hypothetical protein
VTPQNFRNVIARLSGNADTMGQRLKLEQQHAGQGSR